MKVAMILSGTIRHPQRSLDTVAMFRAAGHEVSVYIHTWRDPEWVQPDSFSKQLGERPTPELLEKYQPVNVSMDYWLSCRHNLIERLDRWKKKFPDTIPWHVNNVGMQGMYLGIRNASECPINNIDHFDLLVRLRFDCRMSRVPERAGPGWVVPEGNDFFGLNDQLGWFWTYPGDGQRSRDEANAYFGVYHDIEALLAAGCLHGPEVLLKANFERLNVPVRREKFEYLIKDVPA